MSKHGDCAICGKHNFLQALHGENGGPFCCILCIGKWHGEHGRRRRLGRIVIRAISAYLNGGGSINDIEKLKMSATGINLGFLDLDGVLDPLGYMADTAKTNGETIELTSELLADAIKVAHPDLHPPERRELAHRVTQGLIALQPFTFPAQKPKPVQPPAPSSAARTKPAPAPSSDSKPRPYPCAECKSTMPYYYCADCRAEWDNRQQKERDRQSAMRRRQYLARKQARQYRTPPTICAACGTGFKGKRKDARFCSASCRQRAHRGVTDKRQGAENPTNTRDRDEGIRRHG